MKVYFDNAATTPIDPKVLEVMNDVLQNNFGNPSSTHAFGRQARSIIETSRKQIAGFLKVAPSTIFFTSGGTEADNTAIRCGITCYDIKHAITTKIEHHAVLYPLQALEKEGKIKLSYVNINEKGMVDYDHLRELLKNNSRSFVSLMHANNEIGTKIDLAMVSGICKEYDALFHSDTVQTCGHFPLAPAELGIHFITCSAHKLHGPKGIGFLYINEDVKIDPFIFGGSQERNMRGGTENIYGIAALAKAMEIAHSEMDEHRAHMEGLKYYMMDRLKEILPEVTFNGDTDRDHSLYTVLNVCLPASPAAEMLLFSLDIGGVAASGGSACSSGSNVGSHVLTNIGAPSDRPSVRFSFSKYNTKEEVDYAISKIMMLYAVHA